MQPYNNTYICAPYIKIKKSLTYEEKVERKETELSFTNNIHATTDKLYALTLEQFSMHPLVIGLEPIALNPYNDRVFLNVSRHFDFHSITIGSIFWEITNDEPCFKEKSFFNSDSPSYPPKVTKPTVLGKSPYLRGCYAICGIGRRLTKNDVGKKFVRTLPVRDENMSYDWSYVPMDIEDTKLSVETIVKVESNAIWAKNLFLQKPRKLSPLFCDEHWIEAEKYKEVVKPLLEKEGDGPKNYPYDFSRKNHDKESWTSFEDFDLPSFGDFHEHDDDHWFSDEIDPFSQDMIDLIKDHQRKVGKEGIRENLLAKIERWQKSQSDWLEKKRWDLKETINYKDYTYIETKPTQIGGMLREPNFDAKDPRGVLGLHPSERNFATIRKAYLKLAFIHHPDKSGDHDIFKKIGMAFTELKRDLGIHRYEMEETESEMESYETASSYFSALLKKDGDTATQDFLNEWDHFISELEKLQNRPGKAVDSVLGLEISRLIAKAKNVRSYCRIRAAVSALKTPEGNLPNNEKITLLKERIAACGQIISNYDLNNESEEWVLEVVDKYKTANDLVVDNRVALCRSLAEVYLTENKEKELLDLRIDVLQFHYERDSLQKIGCEIAIEEHMSYGAKLVEELLKENFDRIIEKFTEEKFPKQEEVPSSSTSSVNSNKEKVEEERKRKEPRKKVHTLQSNIKENIKFFIHEEFSLPEPGGFIKI